MWNGIVSNGSIFVIYGYSPGGVYTSPDGVTWTQRSTDAWSAINWNGHVFCAISARGLTSATSPDGITWTYQTIPSGGWSLLAWNGSVFCAAAPFQSNAITSPDGVTWTPQTGVLPNAGNWLSIASDGHNFCVVEDGTNNVALLNAKQQILITAADIAAANATAPPGVTFVLGVPEPLCQGGVKYIAAPPALIRQEGGVREQTAPPLPVRREAGVIQLTNFIPSPAIPTVQRGGAIEKVGLPQRNLG